MFYKFLISTLLILFVAACATKPKDAADSSDQVHLVLMICWSITETPGTGIVAGSQEDLIVNVGDRVFLDMIALI